MNRITLLTRSRTTGRIRPKSVEYDGTVGVKVWNRVNYLFQNMKPEESFFPRDAMEVYDETLALVEAKGRLIASGQLVPENSKPETSLVGVAQLHWRNYHNRQVKPEREAYRQLEQTRRHIAERCQIERGRIASEGANVGGEALLGAIECTAEERLAPLGELRGGERGRADEDVPATPQPSNTPRSPPSAHPARDRGLAVYLRVCVR